jgi:ubiquinone/menaquinone biosynthesis C-methylase UbiE
MKRNDFDLVAPIYDGLASLVFGGAIRRSQLAYVPDVRSVDNALVIGGGTGWFLLELLARTDVKRVVYVELSESMLEKSRELIRGRNPDWLSRVKFLHGTEQSITAQDGPFDLIVTNFFLACFGDANCTQMIERLYPHLSPKGRWLFVDFEVPPGGVNRVAANVLFKVMFTFFNVVSDLESKGPPNYGLGFGKVKLRTLLDRTFYAGMIRVRLMANAAGDHASRAANPSHDGAAAESG